MGKRSKRVCDICERKATWIGEGMRFCDVHSPIEAEQHVYRPKIAHVDPDAAFLFHLSVSLGRNPKLSVQATQLRMIANRIESQKKERRRQIDWHRLDLDDFPPPERHVVQRSGLFRVEIAASGHPSRDLHETLQKAGIDNPKYHYRTVGPDHDPTFLCSALIDYPVNREFMGEGKSKKSARDGAASKALHYFRESLGKVGKVRVARVGVE